MSKPKIFTPSFLMLATCNFLGAMNFYLLTAIFTEFSLKTYGLDYSTAALSVSLYVIGALVARVLLGGQIDAWGLKKSLLIGYILIAVTTCLYAVSMPYPVLVTTRFIQGIGFGIASGAGASGAAVLVPKERRAEGIGYFSMTQALATGIGPFVAIALINITGDYQALFITTAVCAVVMTVLAVFVRLPRVKPAGERADERVELAAKVTGERAADSADETESPAGSAIAGRAAESSEPATSSSSAASGPVAGDATSAPSPAALRGLGRFLHLKVVPFGIVMFLAYLCYAGLITYMTLYAGDLGFSDMASLYFVVYAAAILISRPPMGRRADRRGENAVIIYTLPCLAVGLVVLGAAGTFHIGWLMLVSAALTGFGIGSTHSVLQALVAKVVEPQELGLGNSTYLMMLDLGSGIGPVLLGLLVPVIGYAAMYYVLAVVALVALAWYYLVHGRKNRTR